MSTRNIGFHTEARKISNLQLKKKSSSGDTSVIYGCLIKLPAGLDRILG